VRVEIDRLKDTELRLEEDIPVQSWDMDSDDIKFKGNIHLDCRFRMIGKEILVDAQVITDRSITCSRCLDQHTQTIKQDIQLNYNARNLGNYLDIDKNVREEILINFPMKVLCSDDCKGICPKCGANLNHQGCKCLKKEKVKK
jgi:uncharacterized protein